MCCVSAGLSWLVIVLMNFKANLMAEEHVVPFLAARAVIFLIFGRDASTRGLVFFFLMFWNAFANASNRHFLFPPKAEGESIFIHSLIHSFLFSKMSYRNAQSVNTKKSI